MNKEQKSIENRKENKKTKIGMGIIVSTFLIALTALILAIINYITIGNIPGV